MNDWSDILIEEWRTVPGYDKYYEVSNMGRVRSLQSRTARGKGVYKKTKILTPRTCGREGKYLSVVLCSDNDRKTYQVHRLVALVFIPNPKNLEQIDHINRDTKDNRVENLRWVSQSENQYNTSRNHLLEYNGEIKPLGMWALEYGFNYGTFRNRLRYGWDMEKALHTPLRSELKSKNDNVAELVAETV